MDTTSHEPRKEVSLRQRYIRALLLAIAFMAAASLMYMYWSEVALNPEEKEDAARVAAYEDFQSDFETAMRNDVYGGKTPEETLSMFIAALEKGDVDLASKYFMLETNENNPDYLTRRKWEEGLKNAQAKNRIKEVVEVISKLKLSPRITGDPRHVEYVVITPDGTVDYSATLEFNEYSGIWKIESL